MPPEPTVTEETADTYARESIESVNGGKALAQFVAGDYIVERAVAIVDALRRVKYLTSSFRLAVPQRPSRSATTDFGLQWIHLVLVVMTVLPNG